MLPVAVGLLLALAACGFSRSPDPAPLRPDPAAWDGSGVHIAYLGHATVLLQLGGARILTDPAFFKRIGVTIGPLTIGPARLVAAALAPEDLPQLNLVLVSHAHMDSLDPPSLARVSSAGLLVVPERTLDLVDDLGFARAVELGWGRRLVAGGVTIEAVEVRHWGKRWPWEGWRGYNGYLLSSGEVSVLFASDTAYSPKLAALARDRDVDVAILGNGAYDPWIWNHADPEQVWKMFVDSGARYLFPIHWDTFRLGKEPIGESMSRLLGAAGPEADRVVIRRIGETWRLPDREDRMAAAVGTR